jgi:cardiolipin synthase
MLRHLPNAISLIRIGLVAPIAWAILVGRNELALLLAIVAASSDALDGFLAKRFGWQSELGAWLDPAADKLMMTACFLSLAYVGAVPLWLVGLVIARDLVLVGGTVAYTSLIGVLTPRPSALGRLTTTVQILAILTALLGRAGWALPAPLADGVFATAALATIASGIDYVREWAGRARRKRSSS